MATHELRIDHSRVLADQPETGHNRWHPDITPAVHCQLGDEVVMDTRDAFDGQFTAVSTPDDVANADLSVVHPLTGPVYVEGAEPGDLLVVDVLDVEPPPSATPSRFPASGFCATCFPSRTSSSGSWQTAGRSLTTCPAYGSQRRRFWARSAWRRRVSC